MVGRQDGVGRSSVISKILHYYKTHQYSNFFCNIFSYLPPKDNKVPFSPFPILITGLDVCSWHVYRGQTSGVRHKNNSCTYRASPQCDSEYDVPSYPLRSSSVHSRDIETVFCSCLLRTLPVLLGSQPI